jgi:hypothetical protein
MLDPAGEVIQQVLRTLSTVRTLIGLEVDNQDRWLGRIVLGALQDSPIESVENLQAVALGDLGVSCGRVEFVKDNCLSQVTRLHDEAVEGIEAWEVG